VLAEVLRVPGRSKYLWGVCGVSCFEECGHFQEVAFAWQLLPGKQYSRIETTT